MAPWLLMLLAVAVTAAPASPPPAEPLIGSITILGNTKTDESVVRRELGLHVGEPFPEEDLDTIWDHLEDVGYFAFVDIEYTENAEGTVDVVVTVVEERTTHLQPWIKYDQRHKYLLGAMLTDNNLRGKGERLDIRASALYIRRARLMWQRPWFLNRRSLILTVDGGWERAGFVFRPTEYDLWDAGATLRWNARGRFYVMGALTYAGFHQGDAFTEPTTWATGPGGAPLAPTLWPAQWRDRLILGTELGWDTRDMPYYPTRGAWHRVIYRRHERESGSFLSFDEVLIDLREYVPLPWEHVLALHAYSRYVNRHVPFEDRLYWGGPETIRGYPYARIEGERGYLLSVEYRWPLFLMPISAKGDVIGIGLHVFSDLGDAWYVGNDPGLARLGWGGGVHLNVWNLQFRFEYARTRDGRGAFQFADHFNF